MIHELEYVEDRAPFSELQRVEPLKALYNLYRHRDPPIF